MKFCIHARTRSAINAPGEVRQDSIAGAWRKIRTPKPAQRYIRHLCNMPPIRKRSAKGSARNRTCQVSATSRNQYKSFSIFQPKFHENFVKFIKNAVLVFEPVKWYRWGVQILPDLKFFREKIFLNQIFLVLLLRFLKSSFSVYIKPISTQLFLGKSS